MTIKEYLADKHPEVASVRVTVKESCHEAHPPKNATWTYTENASLDQEVLGHICHDKTSLKTVHFDLLTPIHHTLNRKATKHGGKLSTYWCDDGKPVLRTYDCELTLHEANNEKPTA